MGTLLKNVSDSIYLSPGLGNKQDAVALRDFLFRGFKFYLSSGNTDNKRAPLRSEVLFQTTAWIALKREIYNTKKKSMKKINNVD